MYIIQLTDWPILVECVTLYLQSLLFSHLEVCMMRVIIAVWPAVLLVQSMAFAKYDDRVIYGEDNRREVQDEENDAVMIEVAKSTVVLVKKTAIRPVDESHSQLPDVSYGASANLCEEERFFDQPNPGFCSGFLVGPDTLVTAGHCVRNQFDCETTAFVFDYHHKGEAKETSKIKKDDTFFCKTILARDLSRSTQNDFAVIQLDRKVEGRKPLKYRDAEKVETGANLTVIGHPSGLPTKISVGAQVRNNDPKAYFQSNLDTYGGNSGSAVVNDEGIVEGILVRGEQDFEIENGCRVSKRCEDDGCRGEDVTRSTMFAEFVPDLNEVSRDRVELTPVFFNQETPIPDRDFVGVAIPFNVSEEGEVAEISVAMSLEHSYPGDLIVKLQGPDGTKVTIRDRNSQAGGQLDWEYGYGGTNAADLIKFRGKSAAGEWKLIVADSAIDDTGILKSAVLKIKVYTEGE